MNFKVLVYSLGMFFTLFSCTPTQNQEEEKKASPLTEVKSPIELEWDKVMVVHDEVMPKMSDLARLKKQLKQDPNKHAELIAQITKAEDGMWDWMNQLTPLKTIKTLPEEKAKSILNQELVRISEVKKGMLESIEMAKNELQKAAADEN